MAVCPSYRMSQYSPRSTSAFAAFAISRLGASGVGAGAEPADVGRGAIARGRIGGGGAGFAADAADGLRTVVGIGCDTVGGKRGRTVRRGIGRG